MNDLEQKTMDAETVNGWRISPALDDRTGERMGWTATDTTRESVAYYRDTRGTVVHACRACLVRLLEASR